MRLLHTRDLVFKESDDLNLHYAILSHRWGPDEVSYQELCYLTETDETRRKVLEIVWNVSAAKLHGQGFAKIRRICAFALEQGYTWIWIDTCSINKESSSELSQAINSMFNWYRRADVCYAYLADVGEQGLEARYLTESSWFRRGWTLQELLAPTRVYFLDAEFNVLGSKNDFADEISNVTGIDRDCITKEKHLSQVSAATRMSWAARRKTTRIEDRAYCLLGIFQIHMPLIYGEGVRAFQRLQEEIIRSSDDETIFAHTLTTEPNISALAYRLRDYIKSSNILRGVPERLKLTAIGTTPYTVTNKGVQMRVAFVTIGFEKRAILLNCHLEGQNYPVILIVRPISTDPEHIDLVGRPSNIWIRSQFEQYDRDIEKAKKSIDKALQTPGDPFEYDTIYLK